MPREIIKFNRDVPVTVKLDYAKADKKQDKFGNEKYWYGCDNNTRSVSATERLDAAIQELGVKDGSVITIEKQWNDETKRNFFVVTKETDGTQPTVSPASSFKVQPQLSPASMRIAYAKDIVVAKLNCGYINNNPSQNELIKTELQCWFDYITELETGEKDAEPGVDDTEE